MRLKKLMIKCIATILLVHTVNVPAIAATQVLERIEVYPKAVQLKTKRDRQSFIVQATFKSGITQDITKDVKVNVVDSKLTRLDNFTLYPVADGKTEMHLEYQGKKLTVPITVTEAGAEKPISFKMDVMSVFMKKGCNMGSCHGAASGKDGFRLSIFGFDPDTDYQSITRQLSTRRVNLAIPEESLMVQKCDGSVAHTGGQQFKKGDEYYNILVRWLQAGTPKDPGEVPTVTKVELSPPNGVMDGEKVQQKMNVLAYYSDGTTRDVTSLSYFSSNNDNSAIVSQEGVIESKNRGEAFIMARFDVHTVGSHFVILPKDLKYTEPKLPENNYIDTFIHAKLKKLRIIPSELCTDEEFLRRVYLDIAGLLPTVEEYHQFMNDPTPDKREKLVDDLLNRKEFVEIWVMKWAELLQIRTVSNRVTYKSMTRYYNWLRTRVENNMPVDKMVQELISSQGGTFANAATNYYENGADTLKTAENVAQVFMGMRIQCAQCHNHPFDKWTMDDYYGFAAFFSQIGRKQGEDPREKIIYNKASGEVKHIVGNRVMKPKFLGAEVPDLKGRDRRAVLAEWLASPKNPYFAQNLSNIVWAHFFGKGIINDVDDVRVSNPAVNPELIAELSKRLTEYNYDFKKLVRDICTSRTYQLSTKMNKTNESDTRNFSHANLRRVRSEVLLDGITAITQTKNKFQGLPLGSRAVQIANGNTSTYFLTTFGRAKRETVCACEVSIEPNLSQALHLMNGDIVNRKIKDGKLIATRLKEGVSPVEIFEELYILSLSRRPTAKELGTMIDLLASKKNQQEQLEDVFWALLNSREFLFNH
jgi:Protein of unknown function (DUF1549)/Protein of unknown function (DUF1553)